MIASFCVTEIRPKKNAIAPALRGGARGFTFAPFFR